jgi:hypothetical protein
VPESPPCITPAGTLGALFQHGCAVIFKKKSRARCLFNKVCFGAFDDASGDQWAWRVPILMQALCPLIQIIAVWFMPESPRWLVSMGRVRRPERAFFRGATDLNDCCRNLKRRLYLLNIIPMAAVIAIR